MTSSTIWQVCDVKSPHLPGPVPALVAKDVPYVQDGNRLQTLSIYTAQRPTNAGLVGTTLHTLPSSSASKSSGLPRWQVHIHGGAWRDPNLSSTSIEAAAAHAFTEATASSPIEAVISLNYTLSPFPTHPTQPYDPTVTLDPASRDKAREAQHPAHIRDILQAFQLLRTLGLEDDSYILTGHSAGACLAFQAALFSPQHWGLDDLTAPPRPAVVIGMNGLYDLPALVTGLGPTHAHLNAVYDDLLHIAFGDACGWAAASPARVDVEHLAEKLREGTAPKLVFVDQSVDDQLVPMNQMTRMKAHLGLVVGLTVRQGRRCFGLHAAPWEEGIIIWKSVQDTLKLLTKVSSDR